MHTFYSGSTTWVSAHSILSSLPLPYHTAGTPYLLAVPLPSFTFGLLGSGLRGFLGVRNRSRVNLRNLPQHI